MFYIGLVQLKKEFFQSRGQGVEKLTRDLAYLEIGLEELSRAVDPGVNKPESEQDSPSGT